MSFPDANLENFRIPLDDIKLATQNFGAESFMGYAQHGYLYKGKLSEGWKNHTAVFKRFYKKCGEEFRNEVKFISSFNHENIIPFIGFCDEYHEEDDEEYESFRETIVYELPVNGRSLNKLLNDPTKRNHLTLSHRLMICLDVAKGLSYLHSDLGEYGSVIHRSVTKNNIFLDENLKAKLSGFDRSVLIPGNQPSQRLYCPLTENGFLKPDVNSSVHCYTDPVYSATGFLKADVDVYSFGVLIFDILIKRIDLIYKGNLDDDMVRERIRLVRRYENEVEHFVDHVIRDQIGGHPFHLIKEMAYKCISYNTKDRPTFGTIIKTIELALSNDNNGRADSSIVYIPVADIKLATGNFNSELPRKFGKCRYYRGQLSERWKNREAMFQCYTETEKFSNDLDLTSRFCHKNIITYIGYSDGGYGLGYKYEDPNVAPIIVFEYPINGSLFDNLQNPDKRHPLTWVKRLKICIGAARALKCLHAGLQTEYRVVHKNVKSECILLDENMEAKVCYLEESVKVSKINPESHIDGVEVDVYSFGFVMLETLSGMQKYDRFLGRWAHRHDDCKLEIDPLIRDQIDSRSLSIFSETAYRCLSPNKNERPSMIKIIKKIEEALYIQNQGAAASTTTIKSQQYQKLEDLLIPLNELNLATGNFNEKNKIGIGGFSVVYQGQLSKWPNHQVAIKRLAKKGMQEETEFRNELQLNLKFHHQNIIPFIGYCDEGGEKVLVYMYAKNRSLHHHLKNTKKRYCLTWANRLKICLGAAKALDYLHTGLGENNKVIHRDVKSGNILLDENMEAKICDFGLSKSDSGKQQQTKLYTNAAGTDYYMDPIYHENGMLRTESDVYSFGVVMFEMLCGLPAWRRRVIGDDKPQLLINLVRRYYDHGKSLLIDPQIKEQIDDSSFHTFIEIAYQCISFNSKERPTMETVVDKIEEALDFQAEKDQGKAVEKIAV